jgi:hypothetical protein
LPTTGGKGQNEGLEKRKVRRKEGSEKGRFKAGFEGIGVCRKGRWKERTFEGRQEWNKCTTYLYIFV